MDRHIPLSYCVERMTQEDGTRSFVRLEVVGDGDPKVPCCLVGGHGEVEDVLGDGAIEPAADGTVGLVPCISARIRGRALLMWLRRPNLPHMASKKLLHLV